MSRVADDETDEKVSICLSVCPSVFHCYGLLVLEQRAAVAQLNLFFPPVLDLNFILYFIFIIESLYLCHFG